MIRSFNTNSVAVLVKKKFFVFFALLSVPSVNAKVKTGLDVLEEEGEIKDEMKFFSDSNLHEEELKVILETHVLMRMPNVLITPHNAFNSDEAMMRILNTTLENITGFIGNNRNPKNFLA